MNKVEEIDYAVITTCKEVRACHKSMKYLNEKELQWSFATELDESFELEKEIKREVKTDVHYFRKNGLLRKAISRERGRRRTPGKIDIVAFKGETPILAIELMFPRGRSKDIYFKDNLTNNIRKLKDYGGSQCRKFVIYFYEGKVNPEFNKMKSGRVKLVPFNIEKDISK